MIWFALCSLKMCLADESGVLDHILSLCPGMLTGQLPELESVELVSSLQERWAKASSVGAMCY